MHEPCYRCKILKTFMEIVQSLGISFHSGKKKVNTVVGFWSIVILQNSTIVVPVYATSCIALSDICYLFFLYHKKKFLLGALKQELEAMKELKLMIKIFAQRYGQFSLFTI